MIVKSKTPLIITTVVILVAVLIALIMCSKNYGEHSLKIDALEYTVVTDSLEGGSSKADVMLTDSSKLVNFTLHSGVESHYAGISFKMPKDVDFFDFSNYDSLRLEVRSWKTPKIVVRLSVSDPVYTKGESWISTRPAEKVIESETRFNEIKLALNDFEVPALWFSKMKIENPDAAKFLERGLSIDVLTPQGTMLGIPGELEVKNIILYGKNHKLLSTLFWSGVATVTLFVLSVLWIIFGFKTSKSVKQNKKK